MFATWGLLGAGLEVGVVVDGPENFDLLFREILRWNHALPSEESSRHVPMILTQHIRVANLSLLLVKAHLVFKVNPHPGTLREECLVATLACTVVLLVLEHLLFGLD